MHLLPPLSFLLFLPRARPSITSLLIVFPISVILTVVLTFLSTGSLPLVQNHDQSNLCLKSYKTIPKPNKWHFPNPKTTFEVYYLYFPSKPRFINNNLHSGSLLPHTPLIPQRWIHSCPSLPSCFHKSPNGLFVATSTGHDLIPSLPGSIWQALPTLASRILVLLVSLLPPRTLPLRLL